MKILLGDLINTFDALPDEQRNVGSFNKLFPHCPLGRWVSDMELNMEFEEYDHSLAVEILEPMPAHCRKVIVNGVEMRHEMPPIYPIKRSTKGKYRPVIVDGKSYVGVSDAARSLGLSLEQFKRSYNEQSENNYVKRNP